MLDELRRLDHLPRRLRARNGDLQKARMQLETELGRVPEIDEVAAQMEVAVEEVMGLDAITEPHVSLESVLGTLSTDGSIDESVDRARAVQRLANAIELLTDRLKTILSLHYQEGCSYREIAEMLDVSEPRICQLHGDAIRQLRRYLSSGPVNKGTPVGESVSARSAR